jgi:hypothetical protein
MTRCVVILCDPDRLTMFSSDHKYPTTESNGILLIRSQPCIHHTRQATSQHDSNTKPACSSMQHSNNVTRDPDHGL